MTPTLTYPVGLRLDGRRVLVVGGGQVAQRRIPGLLTVGALVEVVSPVVTPAVEGFATAGEISWVPRSYQESDLDGAWYVIAATDDPTVNQAIVASCEEQRIFCVRADDAGRGTAWTPAVGRYGEVTVAVLGDGRAARSPRRTAALRDRIMERLAAGELDQANDAVPGQVVLVGGGPGDPDLITVAGRKALMDADVVIADRLAPRALLGELSTSTTLIDVAKLPRGRSTTQEEINRLIVEHARAGQRVVRYKGGDNFVFGRGYEEIQACQDAGISVRVIPGVTSPIAVPGLAGIPVTHRGVAHEFTVVSGHLAPSSPKSLVNWSALAQMHGTLVLMMAVENAGEIARTLITAGKDPATPAAAVCDGSMGTQRTVRTTLVTMADDFAAADVRAPAIIVIGAVVAVPDGV